MYTYAAKYAIFQGYFLNSKCPQIIKRAFPESALVRQDTARPGTINLIIPVLDPNCVGPYNAFPTMGWGINILVTVSI